MKVPLSRDAKDVWKDELDMEFSNQQILKEATLEMKHSYMMLKVYLRHSRYPSSQNWDNHPYNMKLLKKKQQLGVAATVGVFYFLKAWWFWPKNM